MDEWCDQQDIALDGDRIYRCSNFGKRIHPRKIFGIDGAFAGRIATPQEEGAQASTGRHNGCDGLKIFNQ
jgi:hypothetical protein